jgi:hypothetical protein
MAIKVTHGSEAALKAGVAIGRGEKREREEAQAAEDRRQQIEIKAREQAQTRALEWELEKAQLRSQQDFEQELRDRQFEYDKINAAREWHIQKMQLTSQMDFQREETERQTKLGILDAQIEKWKKALQDSKVNLNSTDERIKYENTLSHLQRQRRAVEAGVPAEPRPLKETHTPLGRERRELTNVLGREMADLMDINELREEATKLGYNPDVIDDLDIEDLSGMVEESPTQPTPAQIQAAGGQIVVNKQTGERLVSFDGGDNWEPIEPEQKAIIDPAEERASRLDRIKKLLFSKPLEGRIPESIPANTGAFRR